MIRTLADRFDVTVLATAASTEPHVQSVDLSPVSPYPRLVRLTLLALRRYERLLWNRDRRSLSRKLLGRDFDLVVSHDVDLLPLAASLSTRARLLFDAREFYPRHFENSLTWRLLYKPLNHYLCKTYLPHCSRVMTVSRGFANAYRQHYGATVTVVLSVPPFADLSPSPVDPRTTRIVHHGNATPARRIETMIHVMDHLPGHYSLDLFLMPTDSGYHRWLCSEAARRPNVRVLPPVQYADILSTTNRYDVGMFLCPPTTFNLLHTVPNKLFEFIQARLAVAIGPLPDQSEVLREAGCGLIAEDFEPTTMARLLSSTSAQEVERLKARADRAARTLNAEAQAHVIHDLVDEILSSPHPAESPRRC